jgi:3-oxoacyl-[acyl-carrier protein] reductase
LIDLRGRRVLVTGGSRGIGAACCRLFARAGAAVLIQYEVREDAATALLAELRDLSRAVGAEVGEGGGASDAPHLARRCDLRDGASVAALVAAAREEWGALDTLVNNAGVWVENPLARLDRARLDDTLAVNVVGSFLCAAAAVPLLERSPDGSIVNVTSTAGQRGEAFYSPYAASKGAMIAATKSWAVELAPRVRVNSVAPGWVATDMTAAALRGESERQILATIPLGRVATAEEIAGPVLFLASALARNITGEILNVNGGSVLAG